MYKRQFPTYIAQLLIELGEGAHVLFAIFAVEPFTFFPNSKRGLPRLAATHLESAAATHTPYYSTAETPPRNRRIAHTQLRKKAARSAIISCTIITGECKLLILTAAAKKIREDPEIEIVVTHPIGRD